MSDHNQELEVVRPEQAYAHMLCPDGESSIIASKMEAFMTRMAVCVYLPKCRWRVAFSVDIITAREALKPHGKHIRDRNPEPAEGSCERDA